MFTERDARPGHGQALETRDGPPGCQGDHRSLAAGSNRRNPRASSDDPVQPFVEEAARHPVFKLTLGASRTSGVTLALRRKLGNVGLDCTTTHSRFVRHPVVLERRPPRLCRYSRQFDVEPEPSSELGCNRDVPDEADLAIEVEGMRVGCHLESRTPGIPDRPAGVRHQPSPHPPAHPVGIDEEILELGARSVQERRRESHDPALCCEHPGAVVVNVSPVVDEVLGIGEESRPIALIRKGCAPVHLAECRDIPNCCSPNVIVHLGSLVHFNRPKVTPPPVVVSSPTKTSRSAGARSELGGEDSNSAREGSAPYRHVP